MQSEEHLRLAEEKIFQQVSDASFSYLFSEAHHLLVCPRQCRSQVLHNSSSLKEVTATRCNLLQQMCFYSVQVVGILLHPGCPILLIPSRTNRLPCLRPALIKSVSDCQEDERSFVLCAFRTSIHAQGNMGADLCRVKSSAKNSWGTDRIACTRPSPAT